MAPVLSFAINLSNAICGVERKKKLGDAFNIITFSPLKKSGCYAVPGAAQSDRASFAAVREKSAQRCESRTPADAWRSRVHNYHKAPDINLSALLYSTTQRRQRCDKVVFCIVFIFSYF
jgi:hypothetical protein